jgi:SEC-C motif-containing protein
MPEPIQTCPCGTGLNYAECCQPFHLRAALAPTAERLMRSRYSAFVVRDAPYLLATWHPSSRPAVLELEEDIEWLSLTILGRTHGGMFDDSGTVDYVARFRSEGVRGQQQENSAFVRQDRHWLYVGVAG